MPSLRDFRLKKNADGIYDFVVKDNKIEEINHYETAILMLLFMEKRASSSESILPERARGWWGNLLNDDPTFEVGSKIWILEQSRLDSATAEYIRTQAQQSLNYLVEKGFLKSVSVSARVPDMQTGSLYLDVTYSVDGTNSDKIIIDAWKLFSRDAFQ